MTNPMFVHTSKGLINLSLVELVEEGDGSVRLVFNNKAIVIPEKEWFSIHSRMLTDGLVLTE